MDFYQHCTPSTNPLLTLEETSVTDEDFMHTLLLDYHLNPLLSTNLKPQSHLTHCFRKLKEVQKDQKQFRDHIQDTPSQSPSPFLNLPQFNHFGGHLLECMKKEEDKISLD
ncbi:hypothetical protein HYDPIDRAFT_33587 [Hydnomerulius pinastri MD-312]|uniref:Uncharacterized protein n=1 Tax=Hydnomerulius pinastri MD-312 TaxID=994086 RepID=A0A0C9VMW7_9AGAM|nr:hypothetical protein HYDPIDRAFT_33587 [Hydnomerulius pinastri MD-312]